MACDHLIIRVEFFLPLQGERVRQLCLYSPSTVATLRRELAETLFLPSTVFSVWYEGVRLPETVRIVDKRTYQVYPLNPTPSVEGGVEVGEGVVLGPSVELEEPKPVKTVRLEEPKGPVVQPKGPVVQPKGPVVQPKGPVVQPKALKAPVVPSKTEDPIYVAFYHQSTVRLMDLSRSIMLIPHATHRIGKAIVYYDERFFRGVWRTLPFVQPRIWLYDRLRRDFGITGNSSLFTVETAPLVVVNDYTELLEGYFEGFYEAIDRTEEEEGEADVEQAEEQGEADVEEGYEEATGREGYESFEESWDNMVDMR